MGERVKQVFDRIKAFFTGMSKRLRIALIIVLVLTIGVIAALIIRNVTRPYAVLFTDLSAEDMTTVLTYLEDNNISDYRVVNNNRILVPEGQETTLKARIMMQGYPTSGYGYDTYLNNVGALSSQSDRETLFLYDLQDRLAATVKTMDNVRDAVVFITPEEDNRYILSDDVIEATAEVHVTMRSGQVLSDQQATAIRLMVSHAASNVMVDNVAITDGEGNIYTDSSELTGANTAQIKLALESQVNSRLRKSITDLLTPMFGEGNFSVGVNTTVDISHIYRDETTYEQPEWAADGSTQGQGIIGSRVWSNAIVRGDGTTAGGTVGTGTNSELNEYVINQSDLTGDESEISTSGRIDYDVDTYQYQSETLGGTITDVMVSITVNTAVVDAPNTASLVRIVARAAGIDSETESDRVAVLAYPYYEAPVEPIDDNTGIGILGLPSWAIYALIAGVALFVVLLIVILILRSRRKKKRAEEERVRKEKEEAEALAAAEAAALAAGEGGGQTIIGEDGRPIVLADGELSMTSAEAMAGGGGGMIQGADIMDMHTERSMELRRDLRQFAEENPAIAAQMIRNWLRGGEPSA